MLINLYHGVVTDAMVLRYVWLPPGRQCVGSEDFSVKNVKNTAVIGIKRDSCGAPLMESPHFRSGLLKSPHIFYTLYLRGEGVKRYYSQTCVNIERTVKPWGGPAGLLVHHTPGL